MALLPPHRRFAKSELENGLGDEVNGMDGAPLNDRAISEMETFSAQIILLIPRVDTADPGMIFESSRALLDLLSWLANTVFRNALGRYPLQKQRNDSWKYAENRVLDLQRSVQDLAGLHAYVPDTGTEAPIDSALELIYTSVLSSIQPVNFNSGWQAIRAIPLPERPLKGMPRVGMLCWGRTENPEVGRFVVTTNVVAWRGLKPLGNWAKEARRRALPRYYVNAVSNLSDILFNRGGFNGQVPEGHNLEDAWDGADSLVGADAALQETWTRICDANLEPVRGHRTFRRPRVLTALAFDCHTREPEERERCFRCRVLFRFSMSHLEPFSYKGGPYQNRLSCAEVAAYDKCRRWGL